MPTETGVAYIGLQKKVSSSCFIPSNLTNKKLERINAVIPLTLAEVF